MPILFSHSKAAGSVVSAKVVPAMRRRAVRQGVNFIVMVLSRGT
jgi:hypothetical protein